MRYLLFAFAPAAIWAQAITGTVTDPSGAPIPGATVEAASPELIEQRRSVETDGAGRFSIVNLLPGDYTVTVTKSGFSTSKRDGVALITDFTATVNTQMQIGSTQETVTVEAAAPVVDVQAVATSRIMTTEMVNALPTNRSLNALLNLVPGGGQGAFGNPQFRGQNDAFTTVDGARTTIMIGAGPGLTTAGTSNSAYQEMTFSNGMDSPDMATAGARVTIIPKDGGNEFHGTSFIAYTRGGWVGNNITSELSRAGIGAPAKPLRFVDFNPSVGGPILRNKLWFQGTFQVNNQVNQAFNSFANTSPVFSTFTADRTNLVNSPSHSYTGNGRLTWQVSNRDKASLYWEQADTATPINRLFNFLGLQVQVPSTVDTNTINRNVVARWTRTQTTRLLLEATWSNYGTTIANDINGSLNPWSARNNENSGIRLPAPTALAVQDFFTAQAYGAPLVSDLNRSKTTFWTGQASYITGSHQIKGGLQFFRGQYYRPTRSIGDAQLVKSVQNTVNLTLPGNEIDDLDADIGIYLQDKWTYKRLLLNLGLRFDLMRSSTPNQVLPASVWLPSQNFAAANALNYNDVSPRIGIAYDLFGKGKTSLRAGFGRFMSGETVALTGAVNPIRLISTTDSRVWTDTDRNGSIYDANGTLQPGELGPTTNANFGRRVQTTFYDPNVLNGWGARGYTWNTEGGFSQQLFPRVILNGTAYYRWDGNQRATDNRNLTRANFTGPFCANVPNEPRLPGGGGYQICDLWDAPLATLGTPPNNFITFAKNLGTNRGIIGAVNGWELNARGSFRNGAFLTGGIESRRTVTDNCDTFVDNPQRLFCRTVTPNLPTIRLSGAYRLPWAVQFSAVFLASKPGAVAANWAAPIAATTFSSAVPGATRFGNNGVSKTIPIINPVTTQLDLTKQLDFRFTRIFTINDKYKFSPQLDFYNLFNSSALTAVNGNFNPANQFWRNPTGILGPRQFRLSGQFDF